MAYGLNQRTAPGRSPTGGIYQRMVQPQIQPQGDVWETMQRDTRKGAYQDIFGAGYDGAGSGNFYTAGEGGEMPEYLKNSLEKYGPRGLKATYYEAGKDPYDSTLGAGWRTDSDLSQLQESMPKGPGNISFRDLRSLTSDDKNNVYDSKYVTFDPNYGWVTHRKNYDQNADESWFMRNAKTIMPALFTMGIGSLGGAGVGYGMSGLGAARGAMNGDWTSVLAAIASGALGASGLTSGLRGALGNFGGSLANNAIRFGTNQAISRLTNRGGR